MIQRDRAHTWRGLAALLATGALTVAACKGEQPPDDPQEPAPASCTSKAPCGRDALTWLEDPSNRFEKANISCTNNEAGICFGMSLYEAFVAYQVTYDATQARVSVEDLIACLEGAFKGGKPVTIPGCSGPADCSAVYGADWLNAIRNFQIPLNEYQLTPDYMAWVESAGEGVRVGAELEATDPAAALLDRLGAGLPSLVEVTQPQWGNGGHAILVLDAQQSDDRIIITAYDSNKSPGLLTLNCALNLTTCVTGSNYIANGTVHFNSRYETPIRFNDYVDFLADQRRRECGDTCPTVLDVSYTFQSTIYPDDGGPETITTQNKHRFVLSADGTSVDSQTVQRVIPTEMGTATELLVWTKASGLVDSYVTAAGMTFKYPSQPSSTLVWLLPIAPGLNDALLRCQREGLDACAAVDALTVLGEDTIGGIPCTHVETERPDGKVDICVANACPHSGLLIPLQYLVSADGVLRSDTVHLDVSLEAIPDETFTVPTGCMPYPGAPGVEICP
jgi:hypothetical protein